MLIWCKMRLALVACMLSKYCTCSLHFVIEVLILSWFRTFFFCFLVSLFVFLNHWQWCSNKESQKDLQLFMKMTTTHIWSSSSLWSNIRREYCGNMREFTGRNTCKMLRHTRGFQLQYRMTKAPFYKLMRVFGFQLLWSTCGNDPIAPDMTIGAGLWFLWG